MVELSYEIWDIFTTRKFSGNPLAVVHDADSLSGDQMQTIASEFNLSETIFLLSPESDAMTANARIFTPSREMPFAGHPTVGAGLALAKLHHRNGEFYLSLPAGSFRISVTDRGGHAFAMFDCPNMPDEIGQELSISNQYSRLAQALSIDPQTISLDCAQPRLCGSGGVNYIYVRADMVTVQNAMLDLAAYNALDLSDIIGIFLYAEGGIAEDTTWHGRMFAPDAGVLEDPATGSAVAGLPAHIFLSKQFDPGKYQWKIEQGFEMGRPSQIICETLFTDDGVTAVSIGGHGVPIMRGTLCV